MKRIATIQDFSCAGRCSLTVALPIVSACGVECCCIPTAVLSTHTGGFKGYTLRDLTDELTPISNHWASLGLEFDAVYSGYLANERQIALVRDFAAGFRGKGFVAVDPAMADNGVLYGGFDDSFPEKMAGLCSIADVVIPNLTEAALLTGRAYNPRPDEGEVRELLNGLKRLGAKSAVITGVSYKTGEFGAAFSDRDGTVGYTCRPLVDKNYHGTGDIFSSVLVSALVRGLSLGDACDTACSFTTACIANTVNEEVDERYGVLFERELYRLCDRFKAVQK